MESDEQVSSDLNEKPLTQPELFAHFDIIATSLFAGEGMQPQRDAM